MYGKHPNLPLVTHLCPTRRSSDLTSLLHILSGAALDAGYLVLYQSCDADSDFDGMFRSVLGQIPQLYHGGIAPTATSSEVGASLADLTGATPLSHRHVTDLLAPVAGTQIGRASCRESVCQYV